tara:strand:+ start:236 stop:409 length:174 start_codon:yes stop_codon:yes gene_type:complete
LLIFASFLTIFFTFLLIFAHFCSFFIVFWLFLAIFDENLHLKLKPSSHEDERNSKSN